MIEEKQRQLDEAVRKIFLAWANVEISLSMYLGRLLFTDQFRARIVWSAQSNFSARLELVRKLVVTYVDDPERSVVLNQIRSCKTASKLRNKLAHQHYWLKSGKDNFVQFSKSEKFSDQDGMIFLDVEEMQTKSILEYPAKLTDLVNFFASRGNPPNVTPDEFLRINIQPKWYRNANGHRGAREDS